MRNIIIWDSTESITGGTKVSLNIYESLKDDCHCIFFIPGEGEVSKELRGREIDYKVIHIGNYNFSKKGMDDVLRLIYYFPAVFYTVYKYVKKNKIDLIYSNAVRYSIWTSLIGNILSVPVIWHIHHFFDDNKAKFIINQFGKLKSIKKIVFVSNFVKNQFPSLARKSITVYNGIDTNEFRKKAISSVLNSRNNLDLPNDIKIVSMINHIMLTKGQEIFIKSIPHIVKGNQKVHFVLVGRVVKESYYHFLQKLINELGIKKYVSFLGYCRDIPGLLNNVYINTITSVEGCPIILYESHALGVPTLVPDVGGASETVRNDRGELIYEFGNEQDLAQKILKLLKDEDLYFSIRDNCKNWSNNFDVKIFNQKIKRIVGQALKGNN